LQRAKRPAVNLMMIVAVEIQATAGLNDLNSVLRRCKGKS